MPLRQLIGEFGLDPESIYVDRDVSMGLAEGHARHAEVTPEGEAREARLLAAATEYRRAGAHSILLSDWERGRGMFEKAGGVYVGLGVPYGLLMYSLSRDPLALAEEFRWLERPPRDRTQLAYLVLASAVCGVQLRSDMLAELASAASSPIGILGLPVGAYLDLAFELERDRDDGSRITAAVLPFLLAYSSATARTSGDSHHWGMTILPFHPAEPDILSVMCCAEAVLRGRKQRSLLELLREIPLFPAATNILYNAIGERFGDEH